MMRPADNPVLKRFRATVDEIHSERLERVMLYGSTARGGAREDSDYDIAVFLCDYAPRASGSEVTIVTSENGAQ